MSQPKIVLSGVEYPVGGGTAKNFTVDETLNMSEDNVLGVAVPVNGGIMSQEEFDTLSSEKQNHGLYIVRGEGQPLQGVEIEEYDTTVDGCDWHVRKWSNGYCELYGKVEYPSFACTKEWGSCFNGTATRGPLYPFDLKLVYKSQILLESSKNAGILFPLNSTGANDPLKGSLSFNIFRPNSATLSDLVVVFHTVGRWK